MRWFDVTEEPGVYKYSYYDKCNHQSVICTEVQMKKLSGGRWKLKDGQLKKIKRRLEKSLRGDPVSSDDNEDDDMAPLKLPGSEGSTERKFGQQKKKKDKGKKGKFARTPVGVPVTNSPKPYITPIQPISKPTGSKLTMVSEAKKKRKSSEVVNQKSKYESSPYRRGRPPIHDTAYIPNTDGSPEKESSTVELEIDPNEPENAQLDSDANLKPNQSIQV